MTTAPAVPVGSLGDAELALLGGPRTRLGPRPVRPRWRGLDPSARTVEVEAARRSLLARGLLDPDRPGPSGLRRDLRSVLALREQATTVVAVARAGVRPRDHWYAHRVAAVVLLEQVSPDGVHRFALAAAATLPRHVVAAVLHPRTPAGAVRATGPDGETDWLHCDVEVRSVVGRPRRTAWVSGPGGVWRLDGARAAVPVASDDAARELCDLVPVEDDDGG